MHSSGYDDAYVGEGRFRRPDRHGKLGVASFAIGVLTVIWEVCVTVGGMTLGFLSATGGQEPEEWMTQLVGFGILAGFPVALVGIVLGGVAATLPYQKRLFAFLGIAANALVFIGICGLFVIGFAFG